MDQKCTNDTRFSYNKELDENLAWLTQKTEDPKSNKGNLTFPSHEVNLIKLQSSKKVATSISTSTPPFNVYPPFLAKTFVPPSPSDSIFGRSYPALITQGRGGGGVPTMLILGPKGSCGHGGFAQVI